MKAAESLGLCHSSYPKQHTKRGISNPQLDGTDKPCPAKLHKDQKRVFTIRNSIIIIIIKIMIPIIIVMMPSKIAQRSEAHLRERLGKIEPRLPTHCRQNSVGTLLHDQMALLYITS
jgi:hypothetical protein